ncbi:hypothetical protein CkaCkLH20_13036 [Colletotrichum karsti]|uniref:Uncharacterized protein n=1 Tax=Colletotrichum karsti TaxID=1095194 RepID=A0A9P6HS09_9PEZI|nr:uncharacterized protein CkaCkLH20_13036 [Colletotrichum karsti]KAF9869498.1 hypothetical protein CkaCkLH20_13036 [Colletotrichum karsti]
MASSALKQEVERYCFTFGLMHSRKEDIMGRLGDFERAMARPPYNADPADVRRFLTLQMKALIDHALAQPQHRDHFFISERNSATARSAARKWDIPLKQVLFGIAHDRGKQGQPFFRALKKLAKISPVWNDSISLVCQIASARRAKEDFDKRPGIRRSAVGPILSDINLAIESLKPTPKDSVTATASPMSSNQAENTENDDMPVTSVEDHDMDGDDFIVTGIDEGLLAAIAQRIATIIMNCMDDDAMHEESVDEDGMDEDDINEEYTDEEDMNEEKPNEDGTSDNGAIVVENNFTGSDGDVVSSGGEKGVASEQAMSMIQPNENLSVQEVTDANENGVSAVRDKP